MAAARRSRTVRRVGTVESRHGVAWLGEDGVWRAAEPELAETLNLMHSPFKGGHTTVHGFGVQSVRDAAKTLKGTASFPGPSNA